MSASGNVLIRNVLVYGEGEPTDLLLGGGQILEIGTGLDAGDDVEVIDGAGQILLPGFVDMHTHLREPGREDTETIDTGSAAAALGGYTAVFAMANTSPVADSAVVTDHEGRPGIVKEKPVEKPVVLRHGSPSSAERGKTIDLRAKLEDPDGRTGSVKLYFRTGSKGEFEETTAEIEGDSVRAQIPASAVKPPVMDYYFEVVDAGGTVIASRGDAQAPLRIAIPDGGGSGWVLPLAIGGGILGAAAIVGGLALAGVFSSSNPPAGRGTSTVTVNVGEAGFRF